MDTRKRIIDTADSLFYYKGYQSTGINQIIAEADVAKGSLYNHFKSKSELGQAYVENASNRWFEEVKQEISNHSGPKEKLLAIFTFLSGYAKRNHYNGCRIINIITEITDQDEKITRGAVAHKQKFRELLHTLTSQIYFDRYEASEKADSIYLLYEAASVESKIFKEDWPIEIAMKNAAVLLKN